MLPSAIQVRKGKAMYCINYVQENPTNILMRRKSEKNNMTPYHLKLYKPYFPGGGGGGGVTFTVNVSIFLEYILLAKINHWVGHSGVHDVILHGAANDFMNKIL